MSRVTVITDSVAGIPGELAEEYQIRVVPTAYILYDGHSYIEGVTINAMEAYQLLRKNPDKFNTSPMSPAYLFDVYRELSTKSQDILIITVSSALSAFYKSASLAADLLRQESPETTIHIVDSKMVASGEGLIVLAAARAAAQGMKPNQVADVAQRARGKTGTFFLFDTLRYVYRTGRAPKLVSIVGSTLGVKPLLRVSDNGELHPAGAVRTMESGIRRMLELVREDAGTDSLHFMIMHADALQAAEGLSERIKQEFNCLSMLISDFSPVMGYGAGPGALTVGYHPELDF
ncbi:DegV family protein [Chloroflexota bacterium]